MSFIISRFAVLLVGAGNTKTPRAVSCTNRGRRSNDGGRLDLLQAAMQSLNSEGCTMLIKKIFPVMIMTIVSQSALAATGNTTPIDVTVDTGTHTCTSIGQEKKVYKEIYAGDGRYFIDENLSEVSRFGAGGCEYSPDGGNSYEKKTFCVTDADGDRECQPRLVRVIVRAFADCTNNPAKLATKIATECRFSATSKKGNPQ